ncbi:MAG: hypothetical protein WBO34_10515, partial [Gammaproteobacteria bacterium]
MSSVLPGRWLMVATLILLVSACSTPPAKPGKGSEGAAGLSPLAEPATGVAAELIAESAYLDGTQFFIRYRSGTAVGYTTGTALPPRSPTALLAAQQPAAMPTEVV